MPKTKLVKGNNRETKLEKEYRRLFSPVDVVTPIAQRTSLVQPHVLKVVRNVVTYSAYEDPV